MEDITSEQDALYGFHENLMEVPLFPTQRFELYFYPSIAVHGVLNTI